MVGGVDVLHRAERGLALLALRTLIDGVALVTVEWAAVPVTLDEVLAQFRANIGEHVAHVPKDGIVAQDRVFRLRHVVDGHATQRRRNCAEGDLAKVSGLLFSHAPHHALTVPT